MEGRLQPVAQVAKENQGKTYQVLVADSQVAELTKLGLVPVACPDTVKTETDLGAERDRICKFAYSGNEAVQEQIGRALGVHPAILCQVAELVAGDWRGTKIDYSEDRLLKVAKVADPSG